MTEPDIDDVAVERACKGDRSITLNRDEMAAAVALLTRRGLSTRQIGNRLGVAARTVDRWRAGENTPASRPGRAAA